MDELLKYNKALVLLQLQALGVVGFPKAELLLVKAGFGHREIADLLGKTQTAVAKTISRAQKSMAELKEVDDD